MRIWYSACLSTLALVLLDGASLSVARAAPLTVVQAPAADCLDYLPAALANGTLVDWRDTVAVEHCDRIKRLWDLSRFTGRGALPQFFDGYVSRSRLPADVGVDLPLLRVVFPERVFFDTARADLRPEAVEVVRIVARNLQLEPPDVVLFVAGHTDARGGTNYNLHLSVERANAVAEAILDHGVNVAQVWRVGFGEEMPLRAGDNEEAWGQNRRVEFLFAARPEVAAAWMVTEQLRLVCQGANLAETRQCHRQIDPSPVVARRVTPRTTRRDVASPEPPPVHIPDPQQERVIILDPVNGSYDYQRRTF